MMKIQSHLNLTINYIMVLGEVTKDTNICMFMDVFYHTSKFMEYFILNSDSIMIISCIYTHMYIDRKQNEEEYYMFILRIYKFADK
jgi:hypothetical protein